MPLEPELKFRAQKGRLGALSRMRIPNARTDPMVRHNLVSTYFDTPKQKLHRRRLTFRIRRSGDQYQQTIKRASNGSFARDEWEAGMQDASPDFRQLDETPLARFAKKKLRRKLKPVFRTNVQRLTRPLQLGSSVIELAIDRGKLLAGRRSDPITEFELELKQGNARDLFRAARMCEERIGAELDLRSKAERGYRLVGHQKQLAVSAAAVELTSRMTAREAFKVIGHETLRHFSMNADGVRALDAEAIHQMRVGLRRLRAAISLFNVMLPGPSTARVKNELKWLTNELAPARELDVFVKEQIRPLGGVVKPKRGVRAIDKHFSARRMIAFQKAREAIAKPRYRRILLDVLEWLEQVRPRATGKSDESINAFVSALMRRRTRKVRKEGRRLKELSPRERHKLRIKIKKIRYAVEFFENLYPSKAQDELKQFSRKLKKIQNALGTLNDFVAHRALAADAALQAHRKNRRAQAFASGILIGREQEMSKGLMSEAAREFQRLRPLRVEPS